MRQLPAAAFAEGTRYFTLLFLRQESCSVTAMALVQGRTRMPTNADVLEGIKGVLTSWVAGTPEGGQAWLESSEDLNIGDVLSTDTFSDPAIAGPLSEIGIWISEGEASEMDEGPFPYDTVLATAPQEPG